MATAEPTLWSIFFGDSANDGEERTDRILADARLGELRKRLHGMPVSLTAGFRSSLDDGLKSIMSVTLRDVVTGAWDSYTGLKEYSDAKKYPPQERVVAPLKQHTISSSHRPHLELRVAEQLVATIEIEVELALEIDAITLTMQAGKVREVRPGSCKATGTVKCGKTTLAQRKSESVVLPGVIVVRKFDVAHH
jgi:hypothetical protein